MGVEVGQPVDDRLRLLGGRGVVEPDQRLAVDRLAQDREVGPQRVDVEDLVVVGLCGRRRGQTGGDGQEVVVASSPAGAGLGRPDQPRSATAGRRAGQPGAPTARRPAVRRPARRGIVGTMPEGTANADRPTARGSAGPATPAAACRPTGRQWCPARYRAGPPAPSAAECFRPRRTRRRDRRRRTATNRRAVHRMGRAQSCCAGRRRRRVVSGTLPRGATGLSAAGCRVRAESSAANN